MDPVPILGFLLLGALAVLAFWIPAEILHKAGFPRWIAVFIPFTGFIGLAIFAFIEWPVQRELAWLRMKAGAGFERSDTVGGALRARSREAR